MFTKRFLSFPLVIGAVVATVIALGSFLLRHVLDTSRYFPAAVIYLVLSAFLFFFTRVNSSIILGIGLQKYWIGVVSGKAIFGPPLEEYWSKKLQEEAAREQAEKDSTSN